MGNKPAITVVKLIIGLDRCTQSVDRSPQIGPSFDLQCADRFAEVSGVGSSGYLVPLE